MERNGQDDKFETLSICTIGIQVEVAIVFSQAAPHGSLTLARQTLCCVLGAQSLFVMGACCSSDGGSDGCCVPASHPKRKERKKQLMEALAAEARTNELLSRIPGRMCTNGSNNSACVFTQQGRKGTNQDAMLVWENFASRKDTTFCGVFDGHGPYGHLVARRVRDALPSKLMSIWKARMRGEEEQQEGSGVEEIECAEEDEVDSEAETDEPTSKEPEMFAKWKDSFLKSFDLMDTDLNSHPTIDCFCSGTTAVTLLKQGKDLVIANVGDSRAVLATRTQANKLDAIQLTVDLKPNLPKEAERIRRCKGRVFALEDEPEVARVWLPYDDAPGLAMARAFGDFCLKEFGLISVPEVSYRRLSDRDEFIVLATDGVWDVLSNKEVVDIVSWAPTKATAARALVETAVRAWRLKYPTSKIDDCAVVCLYLNRSTPSTLPATTDPSPADEVLEPINILPVSEDIDNRNGQEMRVVDDQSNAELPLEDISFERSNTIRTPERFPDNTNSTTNMIMLESAQHVFVPDEIVKEEGIDRSQSRRSLADCLSVADDEEWSALEGVVRVNSLLNLPRFLAGDKRAGMTRKS